MQHEANISKPIADMSEDEFTGWLSALPPPSGLPSTKEEFAVSIARARADVEAGRVHSHAIVREWLMTLGKPDFQPFKEWLAGRHD